MQSNEVPTVDWERCRIQILRSFALPDKRYDRHMQPAKANIRIN